jgi:hypothetical protein
MRKTLIRLARLATAAGILAWDFGNEDLLGLNVCRTGQIEEKEFLQGLKPVWGCVEVGAKAPTLKRKLNVGAKAPTS